MTMVLFWLLQLEMGQRVVGQKIWYILHPMKMFFQQQVLVLKTTMSELLVILHLHISIMLRLIFAHLVTMSI
jgi:nitrate/nitrite transporter NarK